MPRIALGLEYDGSLFSGWQSQAHASGIQSAVESALSFVANHPVSVTSAGRTDAGVHAGMQVVHFDTTAERTERGWIMGANTNLIESVSALWSRVVPDDFNARYSAMARSYRYVILNRMPRPALLRQRVCWIREALNAEWMHAAAQHLVGEHDFSSFRAAECQSPTPMRRLYRIDVTRHHEYVVIDVTANAFLHHMVRNIAGVLIEVGRGNEPLDWPLQVLQARNRCDGGVTAPASGLYLSGVIYPPQLQLPCAPHASAWPPGPEWPSFEIEPIR
ncbi:MAG TPA: tRNA pseudouridine(38-40) synthase TruA [Steroidobacteraceae bacterium]|nr:tRNA pseudouridine(38-40) synthase TruA [Steroidobacteraceae bacterium]